MVKHLGPPARCAAVIEFPSEQSDLAMSSRMTFARIVFSPPKSSASYSAANLVSGNVEARRIVTHIRSPARAVKPPA